jgi:hypothetical protein
VINQVVFAHVQVNSHIPLLNDDYQESELGNVLVRDWYLYVIAPSHALPMLNVNVGES